MFGSLFLLLVLPLVPGAAPLMVAAMVAGTVAAGVFSGLGLYSDAASALLVVAYAAAIWTLRHLRLRFTVRRMLGFRPAVR